MKLKERTHKEYQIISKSTFMHKISIILAIK